MERWHLEELGFISLESASCVLNNLVTLSNKSNQLISDFLSKIVAKIEDIGSTRDKIILVLNDILEVNSLDIPFFADFTSITSHLSKSCESFSPRLEIFLEGFNFSLIVFDLSLKNSGGNRVTSDKTWSIENYGSGTATIDFSSGVFSPLLELIRSTFGSSLKSIRDGSHFGLDLYELFREGVELFLGLSTIGITRFKSVDKDFDGSFIDFLA